MAFLIYFIPNAFIFAKWTRFMAPVFPVMTVFSILFAHRVILSGSLDRAKRKLRFTGSLVVALLLLGVTGATIWPGIKYLSVYQKPDIRVAASDWIYKNIPENSYILSETANVVDIPVGGDKNYQVISFNFYELDNDPTLQVELKNHLAEANYIFVPSRRIFANHPKDWRPKFGARIAEIASTFGMMPNRRRASLMRISRYENGLKDLRESKTPHLILWGSGEITAFTRDAKKIKAVAKKAYNGTVELFKRAGI